MENYLSHFGGKTVLVFGGAGFIGSNFIRALFRESPDVKRVICFDKLTYSGNPNNLKDIEEAFPDTFMFMKGDIALAGDVNSAFAFSPDYVINFAAETHVDRSIHVGSLEFIQTNVIGVYNILEAVKGAPYVQKYVQVSTDEVYGQLPNPMDVDVDSRDMISGIKFTTKSPYKPNVPYSATKAGGDCLCNAYNHTWHVPVVVTHCSNNYGPYQYPEKMIPFWATRLIQGKKIPIYGDGLNVRDWIHVEDHITALGAVLIAGTPGTEYLIGADNEKTNLEVAEIIIKYIYENVKKETPPTEIKELIDFVEDRPGHDRRYAIDSSLISEELGWVPRFGSSEFYTKIGETLAWYAENQAWVEEVIERTGVANPHIELWGGVMSKDNLKEDES